MKVKEVMPIEGKVRLFKLGNGQTYTTASELGSYLFKFKLDVFTEVQEDYRNKQYSYTINNTLLNHVNNNDAYCLMDFPKLINSRKNKNLIIDLCNCKFCYLDSMKGENRVLNLYNMSAIKFILNSYNIEYIENDFIITKVFNIIPELITFTKSKDKDDKYTKNYRSHNKCNDDKTKRIKQNYDKHINNKDNN